MPTYEYRCPKGHGFEVFQRMSDDPVAKCPECGARAQRLISGGAGFLFKGAGFYITDYRSEDYKKKASKEAPSGNGESAGDKGGGSGDKGGGSGGDGGGGSGNGDKKPATSPATPKSDS